MPSIHVTEWTKEKLDDLHKEEDHSSYDSVIKTLLEESDRT